MERPGEIKIAEMYLSFNEIRSDLLGTTVHEALSIIKVNLQRSQP